MMGSLLLLVVYENMESDLNLGNEYRYRQKKPIYRSLILILAVYSRITLNKLLTVHTYKPENPGPDKALGSIVQLPK